MRKVLTFIGACAMVASLALVGPLSAAPGNKYADTTVTDTCSDELGTEVGTITYAGPVKLWPPNHKYVSTSITAAAIDDGDSVDLATEGGHDEIIDGEELNGSGNTADDVSPAADAGMGTGSATTNHDIRAERSGRGDGRVYTLLYEATFTNSDADGPTYTTATCMGSFDITVPHDMRGGADWK